MGYKIDEIPIDDLRKLGLEKKDVLNFDKGDLNNLLNGKRTSLQNLVVDGELRPAKLSLERDDNGPQLKVHPIRETIKNDISLSENEISQLKSGRLITKDIEDKNGNKQNYIIQLDKEINELVRVNTKDLYIPEKIASTNLSKEQRAQLKSGESVTIESNNQKYRAKLDLNNPKGILIRQENDNLKLNYQQNQRRTLKR